MGIKATLLVSVALMSVSTAFTVNGAPVRLDLGPRESLLDVLRERLGLTGATKGCDHGQCGACTGILAAVRQVAGQREG